MFVDLYFVFHSKHLLQQLASAGFYSCKAKGQPRKTRCFCCLVEISDWKQNDHPIEKHLAASPDCPYARFGGNQSHLTVDQFRAVVQTRNANVLVCTDSLPLQCPY